jgi:ketosteroid isomerase-like protein
MGESEVRQAAAAFYQALNRMFQGDLASMAEVWSHGADVTNMGPFGGRQVGWDEVRAQFAREAEMKLGGRVWAEEVLAGGSGDLGYTVCGERGENLRIAGKTIPVRHRATNIFRREGGKWKLIHHHTDLAPGLQTEASKPRP